MPFQTLLEAVRTALDFRSFVESTLIYGTTCLQCDKGSLFLKDGGTGRLKMVYSTHTGMARSLGLNEGLAGWGYTNGQPEVLTGDLLDKVFVPIGKLCRDDFEAVVVIPLLYGGIAIGVACFDYLTSGAEGRQERPPFSTPEVECRCRETVMTLSMELATSDFSEMLQGHRLRDLERRMEKTATGPAFLRHEVTRFLARLESEFERSPVWGRVGRRPDLLYVQLVDRPRRIIRTVHGKGLPPGFVARASHTMSERKSDLVDIQAEVANGGVPLAIAGFAEGRFDRFLYDHYRHERFTRLWIPLFPVPASLLAKIGVQDPSSALKKILRWEPVPHVKYSERRGPGLRELNMNGWLVWGTLEVGFYREKALESDSAPPPSLSPFDDDPFCSWWVETALNESRPLYRATIDGSLAHICHLAAEMADADRTALQYESEATIRLCFPLPENGEGGCGNAERPLTRPVELHFEDQRPGTSQEEEGLESNPLTWYRDRLQHSAEEQGQRALRLHRSLSSFFEAHEQLGVDKSSDGVSVSGESSLGSILRHDSRILRLCEDACRITLARSCTCVLFERKEGDNNTEYGTDATQGHTLSLLGAPQTWPEESDTDFSSQQLDRFHKITASGLASYSPDCEGLAQSALDDRVSVLPLEITAGYLATLVFRHTQKEDLGPERRYELESHIAGWSVRLSLLLADGLRRFEEQLLHLRSNILDIGARVRALEPNHPAELEQKFVSESLRFLACELHARAVMLTSVNKVGGRPKVIRHWCVEERNYQAIFWNGRVFGPCCSGLGLDSAKGGDSESLEVGRLDLWRSNDFAGQLMDAHSSFMEMAEDPAHATSRAGLTALGNVFGRQDNYTVVVCPIPTSSQLESPQALSFVLDGLHYLCKRRRNLLVELGRVFSEALEQVLARTEIVFHAIHEKHYNRRGPDFATARTIDGVLGVLLKHLGAGRDDGTGWGLGEDVCVWRLSRCPPELILRSARGRCASLLDATGEDMRALNDHPLLSTIETEHLQSNTVDPTCTFETYFASSDSPFSILGQYAKLGLGPWLISIPIVDTQYRLWGAIDLLRHEPFHPQEERSIRDILIRLVRRFTWAVERARMRQAFQIDAELTNQAARHLRQLQTQRIYEAMVSTMAKEFQCGICDLYLATEGWMVLQASTREGVHELTPNERARLRFRYTQEAGDGLFQNAMKSPSAFLEHREQAWQWMPHPSDQLRGLLKEDEGKERMIIALRAPSTDEPKSDQGGQAVSYPAEGLLYLSDRRVAIRDQGSGRKFHRTRRLIEEDLQSLRKYAVTVQRVALMARLTESQRFLVKEYNHHIKHVFSHILNPAAWFAGRLKRTGSYDTAAVETLEELHRAIQRCKDATSQLTLATTELNPEAPRLNYTSVDLYQLLVDCWESVRRGGLYRASRIQFPDSRNLGSILANRTWLEKAFVNLMDNACKYSFSPFEVQVKASRDGNRIVVKISNQGVGIPAADLERIYEPYYRAEVPDDFGPRDGVGIGLAVVKLAIRVVHRGDIACRSHMVDSVTQRYETTFEVTLYPEKLQDWVESTRLKREDHHV